MLQICNISKKYETGDLVQVALNDVSLNLRDNEFVAILGPSGSGKTTLLNIIGGLDRYDKGDLIINNVSTKNYKDRDWDAYRNHTIGFVFQSYNLIPHQTILSNVELALTISGVSAKERKARALNALDEVGLKDQAHKKPNQMSGGQMQRVAIARALVNNPDILLADEPTGALDTKTSIQVMDLLKKVAKDRLVVMVTHNPDLANEYANRIVKLQDGQIISDSNPLIVNTKLEKIKHKRIGKARMGFFTALSLSFNNLLTKKGRTILTAFAGSIGIIGIALILSLSQGFKNYIDKIQEDTLSSYPLTLTSDTADMTSAILSMVSDRNENQVEGDKVRERQYLTTMFSSIGSNDLKSFKKYLEEHDAEYANDVTKIKYSYSVSPSIYSMDAADKLVKLYPSSLWNTLYSNSASSLLSSVTSSSGGMIFAEMPEDIESIYDQYSVLAGKWPTSYDELIIVLSEPNSISDLLVYSLGLRDTAELKTIITSIMSQDEVEIDNQPLEFTYDELMNIDLRVINQTDTYKYNEKYSIYEDMSEDDEFMLNVYNNKALKLKIVGIVCPKDSKTTLTLSPGVNYSAELTQHIVDEAKKSTIVQKQIGDKNTDVFSGKSFDEANEDSRKDNQIDFEDMISIDEELLKEAFIINVNEEDLSSSMSEEGLEYIASYVAQDYATSVYAVDIQNVVSIGIIVTGIEASMYDLTHADAMYTSIDLSGVNLFTNFISGSTIKALTTSESTAGLFESYQDIINSLSDDEYNDLADAVKILFVKYYAILSADDKYGYSDNVLPITYKGVENDVPTYLYGIEGTTETINQYGVLEALASDDTAMPLATAEVADIYNRLIASTAITDVGTNSGTAAMISAIGIGSTMSDLFGEDFMTIDTDKFADAFKFDMDEDELSRIMETIMSGTSEKSYKSNLISLGYQDINDPTSISFYFKDFAAKENFLNFLDKYNESLSEENKIKYTDITGILMSSVKTIVDSVTYVLIAFVSISLVVSSIMIAVITLISVMERTKEIGILRAMGASKSNVSSIFNAETFIIGLLSGLIGVGVTYIAIPPINTLIHNLTDNYDINAVLPSIYAVILVLISVVLTMIAGIIPSSKASKQDPVVALRTE